MINYSYEVPNLSQKWNNIVVKAIFDNWQVSGITSILSGTRQGFCYGYTSVPTGALTRHRLDQRRRQPAGYPLRSDPSARASGHSTASSTPSASGRRPTLNRLGNALGDEFQGPGFMNWDFSFFKYVPMGGTRRLQFRVELYNAFNTDQWTGDDTSATFDYVTGAQTERELRQADRRDVERTPHPARRAVHVLIRGHVARFVRRTSTDNTDSEGAPQGAPFFFYRLASVRRRHCRRRLSRQLASTVALAELDRFMRPWLSPRAAVSRAGQPPAPTSLSRSR